ncbi:hypothetical protein AYI68_g421 [Smittium mucronatum]|uniref:Uncharacterized protein n=1 Tax=Smittium mucronatum TaxID=133383 RepID=A0A1R0H8G0_9FUNG|nr:hypothetical protein AYI68_g421 [Smittium mucronatum]
MEENEAEIDIDGYWNKIIYFIYRCLTADWIPGICIPRTRVPACAFCTQLRFPFAAFCGRREKTRCRMIIRSMVPEWPDNWLASIFWLFGPFS